VTRARILFARAAAPALAVLLLAGCAGAGGQGPSTPPSAAEYRAAVMAFLTCMKGYGYQVSGPVLSPLDQVMLLRDVVTPSDGRPAEYNDRLAGCEQDAGLPTIEPAYLQARPPSLHPRLRDDALACLGHQGVTPHGGEQAYGDYARQATTTQDFGQCLTKAMRTEFPGLPPRITVFY
jgi:hypothetical protein